MYVEKEAVRIQRRPIGSTPFAGKRDGIQKTGESKVAGKIASDKRTPLAF